MSLFQSNKGTRLLEQTAQETHQLHEGIFSNPEHESCDVAAQSLSRPLDCRPAREETRLDAQTFCPLPIRLRAKLCYPDCPQPTRRRYSESPPVRTQPAN